MTVDVSDDRSLSVCPSVCPVPYRKSRMEGHSKLKIGRREAHDMGESHLEVKRSKVKVSSPLNFEILALVAAT